MNGKVLAICISSVARGQMQHVEGVEAIIGMGLKGDRYCRGEGSYNKGATGNRQVTLISGIFFPGTGFTYADSRRNIITGNIELMRLIGEEIRIGSAMLRGVKYCYPCDVPKSVLDKERSFREAFSDRGGLIAEVIEGGIIKVGDAIIPPSKWN